MFHKADGSDVWLRASSKLPYLVLAGRLDCPDSDHAIRARLAMAYQPVHGLSEGDVYWLRNLSGGGCLLFCLAPSTNAGASDKLAAGRGFAANKDSTGRNNRLLSGDQAACNGDSAGRACAMLMVGRFQLADRPLAPDGLLHAWMIELSDSLAELTRQIGTPPRLEAIQPELALLAG
jgi:hypothetical protein